MPSERKLLRLLEGVLHVSQYTDRVDAQALHAAPAKRRQAQHRELHALLSGLLLACDYEAGQATLEYRVRDRVRVRVRVRVR